MAAPAAPPVFDPPSGAPYAAPTGQSNGQPTSTGFKEEAYGDIPIAQPVNREQAGYQGTPVPGMPYNPGAQYQVGCTALMCLVSGTLRDACFWIEVGMFCVEGHALVILGFIFSQEI